MKMRGLWNSLTEAQKKVALEYRGPENLGDPNFPKAMAECQRCGGAQVERAVAGNGYHWCPDCRR